MFTNFGVRGSSPGELLLTIRRVLSIAVSKLEFESNLITTRNHFYDPYMTNDWSYLGSVQCDKEGTFWIEIIYTFSTPQFPSWLPLELTQSSTLLW